MKARLSLPASKVCPGCGPRPIAAFYRSRRRPDGLSARCRECARAAEEDRYHETSRDEVHRRYLEVKAEKIAADEQPIQQHWHIPTARVRVGREAMR